MTRKPGIGGAEPEPGMPAAWRGDAAGAGRPSWPAPFTLDDATLVVRAREGDITAFEALIQRHRVPVYRIAVRILSDPGSAARR